MPSYASKADAHADKITGEWIQIADSEVDDIGAWRYTPAEVRISRCVPDKQHYSSGGWPTLPKEFFGYTQHLVGLIAADYPLEPKPISDIYDAVAAWHHDHNAARVPPQNELYSQLEQAVIVVTAVQAAIYGRVVLDETTQPASSSFTCEVRSGTRAARMLVALYIAKANDASTAVSTRKLVVAIGSYGAPASLKTVTLELGRKGLIDTAQGRAGGCWLTDSGRQHAEHLTLNGTPK